MVKVPLAVVIQALRESDAADDRAWVKALIKEVSKYPEWELRKIDPRSATNLYLFSDFGVEQLTDLVQVLDDLPPIVVKRSKKKGQYDIIDGAHRATAALWAGRNIPAFIPVK